MLADEAGQARTLARLGEPLAFGDVVGDRDEDGHVQYGLGIERQVRVGIFELSGPDGPDEALDCPDGVGQTGSLLRASGFHICQQAAGKPFSLCVNRKPVRIRSLN